jgi:hypothetical protein
VAHKDGRKFYDNLDEFHVDIVVDTETRAKYITALEAAKELGVVPNVLVPCSSIV